MVKWDGVSSYSNAFDYIRVGDYKPALSCQAALDEPDTNAGELVEAGGVGTGPDIEFTMLPEPATVFDGQTNGGAGVRLLTV